MTARRNVGAAGLGWHGGDSTTATPASPVAAVDVASASRVRRGTRRTRPAGSAAGSARSAVARAPRRVDRSLASAARSCRRRRPARKVGSSRRYGTLTTTVCGRPRSERPQPLGRLVVEDPLPPVAGDVLGDHDERDRRRLVGRPGRVEDVEVGRERPGSARYGDSTTTSGDARHLALPALADLRGRPRGRR